MNMPLQASSSSYIPSNPDTLSVEQVALLEGDQLQQVLSPEKIAQLAREDKLVSLLRRLNAAGRPLEFLNLALAANLSVKQMLEIYRFSGLSGEQFMMPMGTGNVDADQDLSAKFQSTALEVARFSLRSLQQRCCDALVLPARDRSELEALPPVGLPKMIVGTQLFSAKRLGDLYANGLLQLVLNKLLAGGTAITELNLSACIGISEAEVLALIPGMKDVKRLLLPFDFEGLRKLDELHTHCPLLEELDLAGVQVDDALMPSVCQFEHLRKLRFSGEALLNPDTDGPTYLRPFPQEGLTIEGLQQLLKLQKLEEIELPIAAIEPEAINGILKQLPELRRVYPPVPKNPVIHGRDVRHPRFLAFRRALVANILAENLQRGSATTTSKIARRPEASTP